MKRRRLLSNIALNGIFLPLGFVWGFPFIWMLSNAFKTESEMFMGGLRLLPLAPTLANFPRAWTSVKFEQSFLNSVVVTVFVVLIVLAVASTSGYALGRRSMPGKKLVIGALLVTMFFPKSVSILPLFKLIHAMGLNNTIWGVILAIAGAAHVMAILLFSSYFGSIPNELEDSARIDGATYPTVFFRIMAPLAKPVFATVGIFNFIAAWNDFMVPLVFTLNKPGLRTLGVGMYAFFGEGSSDWTGLCAAAVMTLLPNIVVFLFFQRYFIEGLEGAVKG